MTECAPSAGADPTADTTAVAATRQLDALRLQGRHTGDPVGFHYLEALSRRAAAHRGNARRLLDATLLDAIARYQSRCTAAPECAMNNGPADDACASRETLADLVRHLMQHDASRCGTPDGERAAHRTELRSIRDHRSMWSKLRANQQVRQALLQLPKNAGPLNSHRVALQSLALMRDISPDYLNRFMTHVDTLLCLEHGERALPPPRAKPARKRTP